LRDGSRAGSTGRNGTDRRSGRERVVAFKPFRLIPREEKFYHDFQA